MARDAARSQRVRSATCPPPPDYTESMWERPIRLAAMAILLALGLSGCGVHLLGTDDVRLEYNVRARSEWSDEVLRDVIELRLLADRITARVDLLPRGAIGVTVDRSLASSADAMLRWRGLSFYDAMPNAVFHPRSMRDLVMLDRALPGGAREQFIEGPSMAVANAIVDTPPPPGARVLLEYAGGRRYRTRVVAALPRVEVPMRGAANRGRSVHVAFEPSTARTLAETRDRTAGAALVVARGRVALASITLPRGAAINALEIPCGDGIEAYSWAQHNAWLLSSGWPPSLEHRATVPVAPAWSLAIASVLLPLFASLAWLAFVRRFDRAHPEPQWLVLATFALGACAGPLAGYIEGRLSNFSPYLDPSIMSLGGMPRAAPIAIVVFAITVGLVEEGTKFLAVWALAARRREFDEPVDGIVYASAAALGFSAHENVLYFTIGRLGASLVAHRSVEAAVVHVLLSAVWGYALGARLVNRRKRVWLYFLASALAHGTFDALLSTHLGWLAHALFFGLAVVFIAAIRASLRHGVVPRGEARESGERQLFRVGSSLRFAFNVGAFLAAIFTLFVYAGMFDQARWHVGFPFVIVSTLLVTAVGAIAWRVSATLPLDVAIDDHGVTFAGTVRAWRDVRAVERLAHRRDTLCVRSDVGDVLIGPADGSMIGMLELTIEGRITDARVRESAVAVD